MSTRIYTKTGDDGTTGLFGGQRVQKYSSRIEAYGTVDELNSIIGLVLCHDVPERLAASLRKISALLFTVGADLATPLDPPPKYSIPRVEKEQVSFLESLIDEYDRELPPLKNFILPGGTKAASFLHQARTVCRRAERHVVRLSQEERIGEYEIQFLNRLSDYLFTAARMANFLEGLNDIAWEPNEN